MSASIFFWTSGFHRSQYFWDIVLPESSSALLGIFISAFAANAARAAANNANAIFFMDKTINGV